jgi:hypothetical protein
MTVWQRHPRDARQLLVVPAKAGTQRLLRDPNESRWIPAYAGMTIWQSRGRETAPGQIVTSTP